MYNMKKLSFSKIIDRIMDNAFEDIDFGIDFDHLASTESGPTVHIVSTGAGVTVDLELAGYSKEDLSTEIDGQIITVFGKRDGKGFGFTKTFRVDTNSFDVMSLKASYTNGLLTLTLSRVSEPKAGAKRSINIQ